MVVIVMVVVVFSMVSVLVFMSCIADTNTPNDALTDVCTIVLVKKLPFADGRNVSCSQKLNFFTHTH
jgi:hypothetical protein